MHKLSVQVSCPYFVFWDEDVRLFWDYVDAYVEQKTAEDKYRTQQLDYQAWLTGAYFLNALQTFGLLVKNPKPYPNEPLSISRQETEKETNTPNKVDTEADIEKQQRELLAALMSYNQRL